MAKMNISIPDSLRSWIDSRLAEGGYADASDYVRDLVQRDQNGATGQINWLQAELDRGSSSPMLDRDPYRAIDDVIAEGRKTRGQA
jgi:antitoxin ParD1/3/4